MVHLKKKKKKGKKCKKGKKKKIKNLLYLWTNITNSKIPEFDQRPDVSPDVHSVTRIYGRIYLWPSSSDGESALKKNGRHGRSLNVAATNRISSVADNRRRLNVAPTPPFSIT